MTLGEFPKMPLPWLRHLQKVAVVKGRLHLLAIF